jgi:hypothetical protein
MEKQSRANVYDSHFTLSESLMLGNTGDTNFQKIINIEDQYAITKLIVQS